MIYDLHEYTWGWGRVLFRDINLPSLTFKVKEMRDDCQYLQTSSLLQQIVFMHSTPARWKVVGICDIRMHDASV